MSLSAVIVALTVAAPEPQALFTNRLNKVAKELEGAKNTVDVSFYVSDENLQVRWGWDLETRRYLASVVKIAYMVELFRQREQGLLTFDDQLVYTEADTRDGGPRLNRMPYGTKLSIKDLLGYMVQSSDNIATDMIGRHLGIDAINEGLAAQGFDGFNTLTYLIDVRRAIYRHLAITADDLTPLTVRTIRWTPIWDPQVLRLNTELGLATGALNTDKLLAAYNAFYAQGLNHARVDSVCAIFEAMERGTLVSTKASEEMYALLRGSRTSTARLLGKLPPGTPVAHKTGSQYQRVCDFGIIQLPDRSHLIAGGCATALDPRFSENAIATLARAAYDIANQVRARQKK